MKNSLNVRLKKRTLSEWLTLFIVIVPFFLSFFIDFLGVPSFIKYSVDVAWVLLLVIIAFRRQLFLYKRQIVFFLFILGWLLYVGIVYLFNFQSPFYFLWGIRNNLRFYIAFIAFIIFFQKDDVITIFRFLDCVFWINIFVCFFQFFILGYKQDYLGGIFGVEKGCNAYTSILFAIVLAKSILEYFDGKESTLKCLLKSAFALVIAAMAEMKFFFILFILIVFISMLLTRFSWRKILILVAVAIFMIFAGNILTFVFGENEKLTFERIFALITSSNYATAEDLGRFTAIPTISETFFSNWAERLFGLGLGNCDTSAFAICNTPFYETYGYLHYSWFSSAFLFLETGYVGLVINLSFFVICLIRSVGLLKKENNNLLFHRLTIIGAILCIIYTFYNSSLRKECGFLMYFMLSLSFISDSKREELDE
jgi:hypothetical protein